MNDFVLFHPKLPNFYYKSLSFLMADCFVTQRYLIYFVKHEYGLKKAILVIPYNNVVRIEDTAIKWSFIVHLGCINEIKGNNGNLGCLKYIIMFLNIQY